jgi:uncharacterized protein (TIGR03084 family)
MDVFDDLVAEQDRLENILNELRPGEWRSPSAAEGWSVADVVLHLAQTEEAVVATIGAGDIGDEWVAPAETTDAAMERLVRDQRASPESVFQRWRAARRAAVNALRTVDPERPLRWIAAPMRSRALATTRIAEHWAHGLDITEPLGIPFPDTDRLRHVAWLGHRTLPYAFQLAGGEFHDVRCELTAPDGSTWSYGPARCESTITGSGGAFCRVGAHRLRPEDSGLEARGPYAADALRVLRNYAG